MQPIRLASAFASKIKPAETHKRVSFTEDLNNQQEFEVEDWSEELSSSRSQELASLDLTGVTEGEWKVLESGDREAMLQMLYDANKVLLELPKGDRKSMKTKIETIEKMLDTHKQLGHPKTSPEQRRALAIAYRRSGRSESPPTLIESPSVQSPQRGELLDQTQAERVSSRGGCLHCKKAVLGIEKRFKCDHGYLHRDCVKPYNGVTGRRRLKSKSKSPTKSQSPSPTKLRSSSSVILQSSSSPAQRKLQSGRGNLRGKPEGDLKGVCVHCQLPVLSMHQRVRREAGYLHQSCLEKVSPALAANRLNSPAWFTGAAPSTQSSITLPDDQVIANQESAEQLHMQELEAQLEAAEADLEAARQLAAVKAKQAAEAVSKARANGDEDHQQQIMLKLFDSILVDQGTFVRAPLVVRTLKQCAEEVSGQTALWLNQMWRHIETSKMTILDRQQFSMVGALTSPHSSHRPRAQSLSPLLGGLAAGSV